LSPRNQGYLLAFIGIVIFALTMPVTRFVVSADSADSVSPLFAASVRALIAGLSSIAYLGWKKALFFPRSLTGPLVVSALGTVIGFPLLLSLGLVNATSIQGAIVTGFLPLATAVMMALYLGKRQNNAFWVCAILGFLLIVTFTILHDEPGLRLADIFLILAVFAASAGYVAGMKVSQALSPSVAICWVLIISLPLSIPATIYSWPSHELSTTVWLGLGYTGLFSMWLGFFAWYKGMLLAGALAASQIQLLQPFVALFLSAWLLGEHLTSLTLVFACALIITLLISRRFSLRA
jgi:drug/metabolite transporter (DMT)-like permease